MLVSETTLALVGSTLPPGVSVFPLGERHLKDIDEPERVYELKIEGAEPPAASDAELSRPAAAPAQTSERFPSSGRRSRQKQWEEDHERRIEDYVMSVLDQSRGELRRSTPGEEEPEPSGVDDIAAHADELSKLINLEILQARRDTTDTGSR